MSNSSPNNSTDAIPMPSMIVPPPNSTQPPTFPSRAHRVSLLSVKKKMEVEEFVDEVKLSPRLKVLNDHLAISRQEVIESLDEQMASMNQTESHRQVGSKSFGNLDEFKALLNQQNQNHNTSSNTSSSSSSLTTSSATNGSNINNNNNNAANNAKQLDILLDIERQTFKTSYEQLGIALDVASLINRVDVESLKGGAIYKREDVVPQASLRKLRDLLETLGIELGDTKETVPALIQHFPEATELLPKQTLSVHLSAFLQEQLKPNCMLIAALKAFSRAMVFPGYAFLVAQFAAIDMPIADVGSCWRLTLRIGAGDGNKTTDIVSAVHSKGAKSVSENPEESFEFIWRLSLNFNRQLTELQSVKLVIPFLHCSEKMPEEKRKKLQNLAQLYADSSPSPPPELPSAELSQSIKDRKFLNDLVPNSKTLTAQWGTLIFKKKKKTRMLIISEYRIFLANRSSRLNRKIVKFTESLLNLKSISSPNPDTIILVFRDEDTPTIEYHTEGGVDQILKQIVDSVRRITFNFPSELKIEAVPPERAKVPRMDITPMIGFIETYKAYCDQFKTEPSKSFMTFAETLFRSGSLEMNLSACPGLESSEQGGFDLSPVGAALRYATFNKLVVRSVVRKDAVAKLATALGHSSTIRGLILSQLTAEEGFGELGSNIGSNFKSALAELDLSHNTINSKEASSLASSFVDFRCLTRLDLSCCGLSSSSIAAVLKGMQQNTKMVITLNELHLSGNNFGTSGTQALAAFLARKTFTDTDMQEKTLEMALQQLHLRNCQMEADILLRVFPDSALLTSLYVLDLSYNNIKKTAFEYLCSFLHDSTALIELRLSGCGLTDKMAAQIVSTICENSKLVDVYIDLSENDLRAAGAILIAPLLKNTHTLGALNLSSNSLKAEGVVAIARAVVENFSIFELNLSNNISKSEKKIPADVYRALATLVNEKSLIEKLDISFLQLGVSREFNSVFCSSLEKNTSLSSLNVEGNQLRDQLPSFAHTIKNNTTLEKLWIDSNKCGIEPWKEFLSILSSNQRLSFISFPENDINKFLLSASDKVKAREMASDVVVKLNRLVKRNEHKWTSVAECAISKDQNAAFRETMEDESIAIDRFGAEKSGLFCVFDGHGGRRTVDYVTRNLHRLILKLSQQKLTPAEILKRSFVELDDRILKTPIPKSGSTAVVAWIRIESNGEKWLHIANIGDTRAIRNLNGKPDRLTVDHRGTDPSEIERVKQCGGVIFRERLNGQLAVTRAFGDAEMKSVGLTAEPTIHSLKLGPDTKSIILASDGLWDIASDQEVLDCIQNDTRAEMMSRKLIKMALERKTGDNVSVVVIVP